MEMDAVTLEQAIELIDAKLAKANNGKAGDKAAAKKKTKKKTPSKKKTTAKKAASG
jgi:DNA topoisomerase-1